VLGAAAGQRQIWKRSSLRRDDATVIELTGADSLVEHRWRKMVCLLDERRADRCYAVRFD
jgi:hypothetical protein